jgi:hypothetical protein
METYLLFGDVHIEQDTELDNSYKLFKKVVQKIKPTMTVCGGDLADFSYISRWSDGIAGMQEGKRLKEDFETLREELRFFKKNSKKFLYLEGNHEARVKKYLEKNPVLKGIMSIEGLCSEEKIDYVETENQPYKLLDDLFLAHGLSFNKYFSCWTVEKMNENIATFHTHRTQSYSISFPTGKIITGYGIGCLCDTNPAYLAGQRISGHTNSFAIVYIQDDGSWQLDIIPIKNDSCIIAGKQYNLSE